jgi:hypothetical protein
MNRDQAIERLAALLTPDLLTVLDDGETALLQLCEHKRLQATCAACRDAPVPPGLMRRPGVEYGCGDPSCPLCYALDDESTVQQRWQRHAAVQWGQEILSPLPLQRVYWRLSTDVNNQYLVRPQLDLPEGYVFLVMKDGRILYPGSLNLCWIPGDVPVDICVYSRAEDGLPQSLVARSTIVFRGDGCYRILHQDSHIPIPVLRIITQKIESGFGLGKNGL